MKGRPLSRSRHAANLAVVETLRRAAANLPPTASVELRRWLALRFGVHRGGPRCWYVQDSKTGELKALPFKTRKAAQAAADDRNAGRFDLSRGDT